MSPGQNNVLRFLHFAVQILVLCVWQPWERRLGAKWAVVYLHCWLL